MMRGALAVACMALATQCAGYDTLKISVQDCKGFEQVPVPMTEDVNLVVNGGKADTLECEVPITITVSGPFALHLSSKADHLRLSNVRFVVRDMAKFRMDLLEQEQSGVGLATFGPTIVGQANGPVFEVAEGSEATFSVPVLFEDNLVADGRSGAALSVDGTTTFEHAAQFEGNRAINTDAKHLTVSQDRTACGGAINVGRGGRVNFSEFASFEENSVENGGRGGAVCNYGSLTFMKRSFFTGNIAYESENDRGTEAEGQGGALFIGKTGKTTFARKAIMHQNFASSSGGALRNEGTTVFETSALFRMNEASGSKDSVASVSGGGHVFNSGHLSIMGDVSFIDGSTGAHGGAILLSTEGVNLLNGIVSFEDNIAGGQCDNLYAQALLGLGDNGSDRDPKLSKLHGLNRQHILSTTPTATTTLRRRTASAPRDDRRRIAEQGPCLP